MKKSSLKKQLPTQVGTKLSEQQPSKNYQISLNERQIRLLSASLDFYSRIRAGQISEVCHVLHGPYDHQLANEFLDQAKEVIFPELTKNEHHKGQDEDSQIMYEMHGIIRQFLALERSPEGGFTVDFDSPLKVSKEPLLTVKRV